MKTIYSLSLLTPFLLLVGSAVAAEKPAGGAELFNTHCKKCHAEDGTGKKDGAWLSVVKAMKLSKDAGGPGEEVLDLVNAKASAADIETAITKGKGKMKAIAADKLNAEQAKTIVQYVEYLRASKK